MKIRQIFNDVIPFKGYKAITIWPVIFVRKDVKRWTLSDVRHETTHWCQQLETMVAVAVIVVALALFCDLSLWWLFAVPFAFYVWYMLEWLIRIPFCGFDSKLAYYNISFEQEAYMHQDVTDYNDSRKYISWCKYIFRKSFIRDKNTHKIVKRQ